MDLLTVAEFLKSRLGKATLNVLAELLERYFRIEVEGLENIPDQGSAVIFPNHSGFAGTDALMILHLVAKHKGRMPAVLAHRGFFEWIEAVRLTSEEFRFTEASFMSGYQRLKSGELLLVFPEGEAGNFKSSLKRYQLQPFHTGFVRMALRARAPLIPCVVIGAEESHLNLGNINLSRLYGHLRIPLPVNLMPLPAKWKIKFLKPVDFDHLHINDSENGEKMRAMAQELRENLQCEIDRERLRRTSIFF